MHTAWFLILMGLITGYAVLDGFDLGVGSIHFLVGRTREERAELIATIGPVWNGNEVWLVAAGGALVAAFPALYAASLSGFYLAITVVIWLLVVRGLSIEFRHQFESPLWRDAWDASFSFASLLLAFAFGLTIANVLRGVPLDADGQFRGSFALMLNPFAIVGGLVGVAVLAHHGAAWIAVKTDGALRTRARRWQRGLWLAMFVAISSFVVATTIVRPEFTANFKTAPWLMLAPLAGIAVLGALPWLMGVNDRRAFVASAIVIASLLASAAAGLYPRLLPALPGSFHRGLDIDNTAAPDGSLHVALTVCLLGMTVVLAYGTYIYRIWLAKRMS